MSLILITLAGAGLLGCFGATLGLQMGERQRRRRTLDRPRRLSVARD